MENNNIIDIKKIVGDTYNAGIYALTNRNAIRLINRNNEVINNLKVEDKIKIFNIFLDKMINHGTDKELLNIRLLFDNILDLENSNLENSINELFKKVLFLYSKPHIDIKEILSISDLVSNRLNSVSCNNEFVKQELKNRLSYI